MLQKDFYTGCRFSGIVEIQIGGHICNCTWYFCCTWQLSFFQLFIQAFSGLVVLEKCTIDSFISGSPSLGAEHFSSHFPLTQKLSWKGNHLHSALSHHNSNKECLQQVQSLEYSNVNFKKAIFYHLSIRQFSNANDIFRIMLMTFNMNIIIHNIKIRVKFFTWGVATHTDQMDWNCEVLSLQPPIVSKLLIVDWLWCWCSRLVWK